MSRTISSLAQLRVLYVCCVSITADHREDLKQYIVHLRCRRSDLNNRKVNNRRRCDRFRLLIVGGCRPGPDNHVGDRGDKQSGECNGPCVSFRGPAYRLCSAAMRNVTHIANDTGYTVTQKCQRRTRAPVCQARFIAHDRLSSRSSIARFAKLLSGPLTRARARARAL